MRKGVKEVEEAPYGFTKSGRKRTKPLKEKAPKAVKEPKPLKALTEQSQGSLTATSKKNIIL